MLSFCGTYNIYYIMKHQKRVDASLRFDLDGHLERNPGKHIFPIIYI